MASKGLFFKAVPGSKCRIQMIPTATNKIMKSIPTELSSKASIPNMEPIIQKPDNIVASFKRRGLIKGLIDRDTVWYIYANNSLDDLGSLSFHASLDLSGLPETLNLTISISLLQ